MNEKHRIFTTFLFPDSTILSGAGTSINLAGNFYDYSGSESDMEADIRAMRNDFGMVGQDINDARENFAVECEE